MGLKLRKLNKSIIFILVMSLFLLTGCLGFESDDPDIPEMEMIKEQIVYSYNKDFTEISGVLFEFEQKSGYFGIVFSHDLDAPHDGYFVLGTQSELLHRVHGDKVKLTGVIQENQHDVWQNGVYYDINSIVVLNEIEPLY